MTEWCREEEQAVQDLQDCDYRGSSNLTSIADLQSSECSPHPNISSLTAKGVPGIRMHPLIGHGIYLYNTNHNVFLCYTGE